MVTYTPQKMWKDDPKVLRVIMFHYLNLGDFFFFIVVYIFSILYLEHVLSSNFILKAINVSLKLKYNKNSGRTWQIILQSK